MDLRRISGEIPQEVKEWSESHADGKKHFASYLQYVDGEIVERVFATRLYSGKGVKITEVYRNSTGNSAPIYKNLIYSKMSGYTPIFEARDIYYHCAGYPFKQFGKEDFDVWDTPVMRMGMWRVYINAEMLKEIPEFRYCGYSCGDVIDYINRYREDHSLELFGKMEIPVSPVLIEKCKRDKQFRRFLWEHRNEAVIYGSQATLYAYKSKKSIEEARRICNKKNQNDRLCALLVPEVRKTKIDRERLIEYIYNLGDHQSGCYNDYLKAIKALKLDLKDSKNVFPNDFARMHDLRIAEYASLKAKLDAKERQKLYQDFAARSEELQKFTYEGEQYSIIIPASVSDLLKEGDALKHCVGKMGYDKKVVDGVSLIAFCRKTTEKETSFVTIEYRFDRKVLQQCYGFKDSKPEDDVIAFVNNWVQTIVRKKVV